LTVSAQQNWVSATFAFGASTSKAYTSVPTAGNVLVCEGVQETDSTTSLSISDDMTDGGTWVAFTVINPTSSAGLSGSKRTWWKVVGASANSNKTVTVTSGGANLAIGVHIAEYKSSTGTDTWSENGTPAHVTTTGTNPSPGSLTTTGSGAWVIIGSVIGAIGSTAAAGYTRQVNDIDNFVVNIEDKFTTAAATETPSWTGSSQAYAAAGFALKATAAAGGGVTFPQLERLHRGEFRGEHS
jgi:hypothetical protein